MHGYSRPVRCSLLAIPTVLNLFIFPPHIYLRVTFRLLLLYLSRMPIKLLKKKKKKKFFLLPTVACSLGLVLHQLCRVPKNSLVMSLYNLLYVRHATIAQFEGVSVADLPQFMASTEALIDKV